MVTLDLNEILEGAHVDIYTVKYVEGRCKCGEYVDQKTDICPFCKEEVVWKNSKIWNQLYLNGESNVSAWKFLKRVKVKRFKDGREYHRWRAINLTMPEHKILEQVDRCRAHLREQSKAVTGRAVMRYALNVLEKKLPDEEEGYLGRVGDTD